MGKMEDFGLRSTDSTTLKILEYIANNPKSSRTDLRVVTSGVKTIENSLLFLEIIGAISIIREEYKGKDAWFSETTDLGNQILINAGFDIEIIKRIDNEIVPINFDLDWDVIRGTFSNAHIMEYIEDEEWDEINGYFERWKNGKNQKTTKIIVFKKLLVYLKRLMKLKDYNTKEINNFYKRMEYTIELLKKE